MERPYRVRRSCLAVPTSSERFIDKARGLPADEVFLDLEDAVAPAAKAQARANAAAAVTGDWGGRLVAVRVHRGQIEAVNQTFAPSEADYSRAARIIEAYAYATTVDQRGAVMLGDEMIDEASRKMAEVIVARGNAAGFAPGEPGQTPECMPRPAGKPSDRTTGLPGRQIDEMGRTMPL